MAPLPTVSGKEAVKALKNAGYEFSHQRGSHMILRYAEEPYRRISVPDHKELRKGLLRAIIRDAGLTVDQFRDLL
jgi:predicted RNA binding protein YcfA (HicA-like mRNA interferase family)